LKFCHSALETILLSCPGPRHRATRRHAAIYGALETILDSLDDPLAAALLIARFELAFLAELGFGLDLGSCAATGATADLVYVSPRSGRAVSRGAGEAYRDKLLRLPGFLRAEGEPASATDLADAFALTGFFLDRRAFAPRGLALPDARAHFVAAITRSLAGAEAARRDA
jgi:DNA repair protein RecO (recombination protein O)